MGISSHITKLWFCTNSKPLSVKYEHKDSYLIWMLRNSYKTFQVQGSVKMQVLKLFTNTCIPMKFFQSNSNVIMLTCFSIFKIDYWQDKIYGVYILISAFLILSIQILCYEKLLFFINEYQESRCLLRTNWC